MCSDAFAIHGNGPGVVVDVGPRVRARADDGLFDGSGPGHEGDRAAVLGADPPRTYPCSPKAEVAHGSSRRPAATPMRTVDRRAPASGTGNEATAPKTPGLGRALPVQFGDPLTTLLDSANFPGDAPRSRRRSDVPATIGAATQIAKTRWRGLLLARAHVCPQDDRTAASGRERAAGLPPRLRLALAPGRPRSIRSSRRRAGSSSSGGRRRPAPVRRPGSVPARVPRPTSRRRQRGRRQGGRRRRPS